ncbi:MAG: peptidyl-prolyl cis-trans isomerase [Bacteroidales bacterium]|nr:peptidyl-prolyl cis-trans isomerase [Bacteroidales bacterium]MCF8344698.1 peptidyl-prolyl cis-trans isomerase [Bacteroidales bacterium]MCF8350307.1 peptidyl-prolyl cis-trans isomerase [Bacteroidales bacterium]MCF8374746.1 peptidyl-prolyl cis-trans isomerase [Bacteroidales bacterium]MCF8399850.1 peptidyl-prolyl cis-trans isomerase [Bacteroidales bacterium]
MKKFNFVLGMVFTLVLAWTSQSVAQDYLNDNRTLLEIGDDKVSVAEFMRVYQKNNLQSEVMDKKSVDEYLDLYINFKLKVKQAEDLGLDTVSSFVNELSGYRKQLTKPYFIDEEVNEELIHEAYERKQYDIRASHILIRVAQNASAEDTAAAHNKAIEILEKARAGEDFNLLAVEFSDDPSARDVKDNKGNVVRKGNEGDLGYFSVFDMVYPFETGAYSTAEGKISEPIRTRYGYHLIKVTDRKPAMGKARVAHIYAKFPQQPSAEDSATLKERINKAYEELESGTDFVEVVEKYSDDKASRLKGGQLPIFNSNKMVPEFIYRVSLLEDTMYSKPFLTQYGWHIIRLLERNRPGTFEEEEDQIRERLAKDIRSHKSKQAVIKKIKEDYRFKEYNKNKEKFFAAVDSSLLKQEWSADSVGDMDKKLFKLGKEKYTQHDFAVFLEEKQKAIKPNNIRMYLETSYKEFVDNSCIHYLDKRLETIYPDFGLLMKEYRDGILLFELTDQKVWSKAIEDTTGLENFYAENKDSYMWDERLDATIYTILAPDSLDAVYEAIEAGKIEEDLAGHFNNDSVTVLSFRQDLFEEGENNLIDNVSWEERGIYKDVDKDGHPVIIHVQEILPPQHKKLNEARGLVIADYQNHLEKQWIKSLKEKYPVEVNEKVLSSLKK